MRWEDLNSSVDIDVILHSFFKQLKLSSMCAMSHLLDDMLLILRRNFALIKMTKIEKTTDLFVRAYFSLKSSIKQSANLLY